MTVPPVVIWTVGIVGGALLARLVIREWQRAQVRHARTAPVANVDRRALPKLRRDPVTGVYRP